MSQVSVLHNSFEKNNNLEQQPAETKSWQSPGPLYGIIFRFLYFIFPCMLVGTHNFYLVEKGVSNVNKVKSRKNP